jgi:hypothetical protein
LALGLGLSRRPPRQWQSRHWWMHAGPPLRAEPGSADYTRRRPAALEAPVLGLGRSRRPQSPSPRTGLRARRSESGRAPLTTPPPFCHTGGVGRRARPLASTAVAVSSHVVAGQMRACLPELSRAPLTTPAVVPSHFNSEAPVLLLGRSRRTLSTSPRTWLPDRRSELNKTELLTCDLFFNRSRKEIFLILKKINSCLKQGERITS